MFKLISVFFALTFSLISYSQSFKVDSKFNPFFDIRNQKFVQIQDIYESKSKKLYLSGSFEVGFLDDIISINRDGSKNFEFTGNYGGRGIIQPLSDSVLLNGLNIYGFIDTLGNGYNQAWFFNYRKTVQCSIGIPYFFPDGSSLFANRADNTALPCKIVNPPDTFPGSYIIKLTPEGLWDSTFKVTANAPPWGFVRYDNNRIIVYGNPRDFKTYNGVKIDGMCRIFLDGTLDTTFHSPLLDTTISSGIVPDLIQENGSFFISGRFLLKEKSGYHTLAKLNADGSLDNDFMNFSGAIDTIAPDLAYIYSIEPTPDSGFLVGGRFTHYQGIRKNAIAKIDKNGKLQPQFFTSPGPDSTNIGSIFTGGTTYFIEKSKFGGYYVGGWFTTWDGKPVQPIIRLTGLDTTDLVDNSTSVLEINQTKSQVKLFPNPTNGKVYLTSNEIIEEINVLNAVGQVIQTYQPNKNEFSWELPEKQGFYFVRIRDKIGNIETKKIINQ